MHGVHVEFVGMLRLWASVNRCLSGCVLSMMMVLRYMIVMMTSVLRLAEALEALAHRRCSGNVAC